MDTEGRQVLATVGIGTAEEVVVSVVDPTPGAAPTPTADTPDEDAAAALGDAGDALGLAPGVGLALANGLAAPIAGVEHVFTTVVIGALSVGAGDVAALPGVPLVDPDCAGADWLGMVIGDRLGEVGITGVGVAFGALPTG